MNATNDMSEIAAGLGSGVSQDQIRTSIEYGEQYLKEIKERGKTYSKMIFSIEIYNHLIFIVFWSFYFCFKDFSEYKTNSYKEQATARELVANVTLFTLPGKIFKQEVQDAENKREELESKLEDLKNKSQTAGEEVRYVTYLSFARIVILIPQMLWIS